jgi:hypothetical protein
MKEEHSEGEKKNTPKMAKPNNIFIPQVLPHLIAPAG